MQLKTIEKKQDHLNKLLSNNEQMQYLPEYNKLLELLKHMSYVDKNGLVNLKGRVSCEFCMHEILMTEMVMENAFKVIF